MEPKPYEEMIEVCVSGSSADGEPAGRRVGAEARGKRALRMVETGLEEELVRELPPDEETLLPGPVQQYLQEIGVVRLLTAKQEVELAKKIENGRLLARLQRELTANHQPLS